MRLIRIGITVFDKCWNVRSRDTSIAVEAFINYTSQVR